MKKPLENIINNVLNNTADKAEAKKVVEWFSTAEGQAYLKKRMDDEHYHKKKQKHQFEFSEEKVHQTIQRSIRKKKNRHITWRVATVLTPLVIMLSVLGYLGLKVGFFEKYDYQTVATQKGKQIQVVLQDGTHIHINPNTSITFPKKFGFSQRKIKLNGEAYFVVSENTNRPFIVDLEDSYVKVLGTSFNIKSYEEDSNIDIVLNEGSILFSTKNNISNLLKEGEKLKYNKRTGKVTISHQLQNKTYDFTKDKVILFDKDNLKTVIRTLSAWYNKSFVVKDTVIYKYSYTSSFKNASLNEIISELEKVSPIIFSQKNDKIYVEIKK